MNNIQHIFPEDWPSFEQKVKGVVGQLIQEKRSLDAEKLIPSPSSPDLNGLVPDGFPSEGRGIEEGFSFLKEKLFAHYAPSDHVRNFAFIPGPASPVSWLGDLITSSYNPHASNSNQSAGPSVLERKTIEYLNQLIGFPPTAGGLFLSGGSVSNLTAVVAARDAVLNEHTRAYGVAYLSDQTHSSVIKALKIAGFYGHQIRIIETGQDFKMNVDTLRKNVEEDAKQGLKPFIVIATAGTTNTGSIDPLEEIADLCYEQKMWMHVDGAFGASIAFSGTHRHLLSGVERADSVTWDAHKWLFQTYACGILLVRNPKYLYQSFHADPEYLRDTQTNEDTNFMSLGPELTRPARAVKLWFTLQTTGLKAIEKAIDCGFSAAEYAEEVLRQQTDWEVVSEAQLGILNIRYAPKGYSAEEQDRFTRDACDALRSSGYAWVMTTQLKGRTVARLCIINPQTSRKDIEETIFRLQSFALDSLRSSGTQHSLC